MVLWPVIVRSLTREGLRLGREDSWSPLPRILSLSLISIVGGSPLNANLSPLLSHVFRNDDPTRSSFVHAKRGAMGDFLLSLYIFLPLSLSLSLLSLSLSLSLSHSLSLFSLSLSPLLPSHLSLSLSPSSVSLLVALTQPCWLAVASGLSGAHYIPVIILRASRTGFGGWGRPG